MSQEAKKVSGPPKHDEKGNDGSEKITDSAWTAAALMP